MRIVIDGRNLRTSTGRYHRELLNNLQELDHENHYIVLVNPKDEPHWKPSATNFHRLTVPYRAFGLGEQLGLAWQLYRLKPDLVHFLMPQQPLLYRKRAVTTVHDLTLVHFEMNDKNKWVYRVQQEVFKFLLKVVARRSKRILTVSQYTKDDLVQFAKIMPDKVTVTHLAGDQVAKFKPAPVKELTKTRFVLFVGNAFPYKNLSRLCDAVAELQETLPDLHLACAGKPDFFYEQLARHIADHGYQKMHLLGFVSDEQLAWLYSHAEAYVFPSLSEGFGLPGLEAMQYELPVVAAAATSLPEVYADAAIYFDPKDTADMATAILKVIEDPKLRKQLVEAGRERLKEFSWRRTAEQTLETYKQASK